VKKPAIRDHHGEIAVLNVFALMLTVVDLWSSKPYIIYIILFYVIILFYLNIYTLLSYVVLLISFVSFVSLLLFIIIISYIIRLCVIMTYVFLI
jgi:hypothetical protein